MFYKKYRIGKRLYFSTINNIDEPSTKCVTHVHV